MSLRRTLKAIRNHEWRWLTQLNVNRKVNLDFRGSRAVAETAIAATGTVAWLEGYGPVKVFKIVSQDGDIEYWATGDVAMDELARLGHAEKCWAIKQHWANSLRGNHTEIAPIPPRIPQFTMLVAINGIMGANRTGSP